ncbi:peroxisomal membrane protein 11C [Tribolium castaneum]|uniref:Peroxisomal membrane protein 11C-like Protein n=1 Tax=Tribolium castaneum TaxID=7070 RepID=D6X3J5_TRICA|nr:PREDICTED: peroxisomal membrane protein 11C [Tribolium castaneum]EEZ97396.1 Peroxisomal membrane protein 11C-like Protein [Tribolium castaneum]|eukprot:XP_973218.1 PREDICTED: peroxisomal membrane protein 11C [Tribolium castaneum]
MSSYFLRLLDEICKLLETYKGRDKVLRTLCYTTKLIGGLHGNKALADKFLLFSKHMSGTRATLRLLDDLPMLKYNLEYGFGKEEPDKLMAALGVTTNVIDQVYYPVEKIAWLAEHKLITGVDNNKWDTISSIFWVSSIYLTLMRSLRFVSILQKHRYCGAVKNDESVSLEKLLLRRNYEVVTCVRLCLDFVHAVNTLPKGFLWSSKLNTWQVGLIATTSSVLGIYQIYAKRDL